MFITILSDNALVINENNLLLVAATTLSAVRKCVKCGNYQRLTEKEFNKEHNQATKKLYVGLTKSH